nr:BV-like protein [Cotesia vestalis bracovirus]
MYFDYAILTSVGRQVRVNRSALERNYYVFVKNSGYFISYAVDIGLSPNGCSNMLVNAKSTHYVIFELYSNPTEPRKLLQVRLIQLPDLDEPIHDPYRPINSNFIEETDDTRQIKSNNIESVEFSQTSKLPSIRRNDDIQQENSNIVERDDNNQQISDTLDSNNIPKQTDQKGIIDDGSVTIQRKNIDRQIKSSGTKNTDQKLNKTTTLIQT